MATMLGMGGVPWPWCSAGCSTPCGGIGRAAVSVGVGGLGCLRILGGRGGDLAMVNYSVELCMTKLVREAT